jgi:hypothetical protein
MSQRIVWEQAIAFPSTLVRKQPAFALETSTIAGKSPVSANYAMAGHDHADGVRSIGQTYGSDCLRTPDTSRKFGIGYRVAARYFAQSVPDSLLKWRSDAFDGQ